MRETAIEKLLKARAESMGGVARKYVTPSHRGSPDRLILLPGGKIGFAETKAPVNGVLSVLQAQEIKLLRRLGFIAEVLNDPEYIPVLLEKILKEG